MAGRALQPPLDFQGRFLRNLSINLSDNLVFENSVTDFTPHFLSKG